MLTGIHPALTGRLLLLLDEMGHSDLAVVADAHFPAHRFSAEVVELPMISSPAMTAAVRTVFPLDTAPAFFLMAPEGDEEVPAHRELIDAAGLEGASHAELDRAAFYALAETAFVIIRTGEFRIYANAALRKGVVGHTPDEWR